jgi:hypothetical protein
VSPSYASGFFGCRFGSNTPIRHNRMNWDKPIDPGLMLLPNAWWRLTPDP